MNDVAEWLASLAPGERDAAWEAHLGLLPAEPHSPGEHLIGYHPAGVASIALAVQQAQPTARDVFIDLGAGRGKVLALVQALADCQVRGVELQPHLVASAAKGTKVEQGDARTAPLDDGTIFFLYLPFEGPVLDEVLERLHAVARHHAIVVCALGVDVARPWLRQRAEVDSLWLDVFDSDIRGVAPRVAGPPTPNRFLDCLARAVLRSPP